MCVIRTASFDGGKVSCFGKKEGLLLSTTKSTKKKKKAFGKFNRKLNKPML